MFLAALLSGDAEGIFGPNQPIADLFLLVAVILAVIAIFVTHLGTKMAMTARITATRRNRSAMGWLGPKMPSASPERSAARNMSALLLGA